MVQPADLERDFGVRARGLRPHVGGYESDCWVANDAWFVKVWKQPGQPPGLRMLQQLQDLGLPAPMPAVSGELYAVLAAGRTPFSLIYLDVRRTATTGG